MGGAWLGVGSEVGKNNKQPKTMRIYFVSLCIIVGISEETKRRQHQQPELRLPLRVYTVHNERGFYWSSLYLS